MKTLEIIVESPVYSWVNYENKEWINSFIGYEKEFWKKNFQGRMERKTYIKSPAFRSREKYYFYTGYNEYIKSMNKDSEKLLVKIIDTEKFPVDPDKDSPELPGITFREDQLRMINACIDKQRGVIKAATGIGKTIIQLGLASMYPEKRILILAHTIDIVDQTYDKAVGFGFEGCQKLKEGGRNLEGRFVFATIQSFQNLDPESFCDYFDIVMIDEVHRFAGFDGMYAEVMKKMLTPMRLGFTATIPTNKEHLLAIIGHVGPIVGEITINQAAKDEILSTPKIRIVKLPLNWEVKRLRTWEDVVEKGIVDNEDRNQAVADLIEEYLELDKTVLVFVTRIRHGENIFAICLDRKLPVNFVFGGTKDEIRSKLRKNMAGSKKGMAIISSVVWRTGVDLPNLDVVVLAYAGKSEIETVQSIGRGLRRTADKDECIIVDFFDPSNYHLVNHFGERISLYCNNRWI